MVGLYTDKDKKMAVIQNLVIDQYSTFRAVLTVYDSTRYPLNLTGYIAEAQMRKSWVQEAATATFLATVVSPASNGQVSISLTDEQTGDIAPGRYLYDVVVQNNTGERFRAIEGIINVDAAITRPTP